MNIFVGNLSFLATNEDVRKVFEAFGIVDLVSIKKKSGQNSRGFGFVTMPIDEEGQAAIAALEGKEFMGRPMSVTLKRPKPEKPKKDYKEIKRVRREAKMASAPVIEPVVKVEEVAKPKPKAQEVKPRRKTREEIKFSQPQGSRTWEKRKGRGTSKPWKKTPGGIKKKFKSGPDKQGGAK